MKPLSTFNEYMVGYGAVVSSARPGSTSHSDAKGKYVAKTSSSKKKKVVKEEGAPTMSTGSTAAAAGFSGDSDPNGPTAGLDEPLGGIGRPLKGRKFKCKTNKKTGTIKCGPSTTKKVILETKEDTFLSKWSLMSSMKQTLYSMVVVSLM